MATFHLARQKTGHARAATSKPARTQLQPARKLLSAEQFALTLLMERRRSERSGRSFVLVLISGETLDENQALELSQGAANGLASAIREVDVFGWYKESVTLGLIMEVGDSPNAPLEAIVEKISHVLQQSLSVEAYCKLAMIVRAYPDDGKDEVFYPELHAGEGRAKFERGVKRAIDVVGSLAAIALFSPLFLLIAILIKCTSRGPILYCKERVGQYGRLFCFYKFRTMLTDNNPEIHRQFVARLISGTVDTSVGGGVFKLTNDPRVTKLGRFLRRTSLDELPQFFNVLLDDMSLVGPRPPLPYEYENYRSWHKRRVLEFKPGITGLWQIEGRSRTTFDEMVRMDLRYAKTRSIWMDLKIILNTPAAMFSGRGAC